jgi:ABC-type glycerol-3-phosphate transport system permease component
LSVILTGVFDPVGFFLMHDFMKRIPRDFVESARIDGAGEIRILLRIMFPLCKPVLGVVMAFQSLTMLSDFMWQRLLLQDEAQMTWVVGIVSRSYAIFVRHQYVRNYGVEMSSGILLFLPMLIIFLLANRSFIGGITLGGLKD